MMENVYLTIVIVVILMFLDYYLTLKSDKIRKLKAYKHFKFESFELNPKFKESISSGRYNPKHFLSVILVSIFVYVAHYFDKNIFFTIQGMIFSMFIYINTRHIQNLYIFNAINKKPSIISGKINQSHEFSLKHSMSHAIGAFLILILVFIFIPSYFTFGFAMGPLAILQQHRKWLKKHLKNKRVN